MSETCRFLFQIKNLYGHLVGSIIRNSSLYTATWMSNLLNFYCRFFPWAPLRIYSEVNVFLGFRSQFGCLQLLHNVLSFIRRSYAKYGCPFCYNVEDIKFILLSEINLLYTKMYGLPLKSVPQTTSNIKKSAAESRPFARTNLRLYSLQQIHSMIDIWISLTFRHNFVSSMVKSSSLYLTIRFWISTPQCLKRVKNFNLDEKL
jgi:hypothetical protein